MIDPKELRRALVSLRVDCDDANAVAVDMLRPPRRRELGPRLHRQHHDEARSKIVAGIAYLLSLAEEPESGDPAGVGGAGPTH